jgi:hypothetical protein
MQSSLHGRLYLKESPGSVISEWYLCDILVIPGRYSGGYLVVRVYLRTHGSQKGLIISKSLRSFPFQFQTAQVIGRSILNLRFLLFSPHAQLWKTTLPHSCHVPLAMFITKSCDALVRALKRRREAELDIPLPASIRLCQYLAASSRPIYKVRNAHRISSKSNLRIQSKKTRTISRSMHSPILTAGPAVFALFAAPTPLPVSSSAALFFPHCYIPSKDH